MIVPVKTARIARSALRVACLASALGISAQAQTTGATPSETPKPPAKQTTSPANNVPSAQEVTPTGPAKTEPAPVADSDTIMLSPFEVVSDNKGYMASNSASGTRLNSRLEDLASPISVVTKQQLSDMAAVDLNDIFRSEANVEGFYQYTEFTMDNNRMIDTASNNPEANNRIRGIGQANITAGGMNVSGGTPIDTYNVDSVEISRGANSNIFGIGSTSGTVNLNLATGNLTRDLTKFSFMTDDRGRLRETFDLNRVILRNKLAFRVLGAHDKLGFVREPSSSITKRFTFAARAQPFKKTSIKFSYETFRNAQSLPNAMTPRQAITAWQGEGSLTWDPVTYTVRDLAGNIVGSPTNPSGQYLGLTTAIPNGAAQLLTDRGFTGGLQRGSDAQRPVVGYINGSIAYFIGESAWTYRSRNNTTLANTYDQNGNARLVQYVPIQQTIYVPEINPATGQPFGNVTTVFNEQLRGIDESQKHIYDWTEYNINASNHSERKTNVTRAEIEQYVFNTGTQQLAFQFAGLREDIEANSWNFIGNGGDGVDGIIYIDPNRTLPNGQPNPGYLRPYIRSRQPQRYYRPEESFTLKGQMAYVVDLTNNKGWTKWFGRHNFVGYMESRERKNVPNAVRYRSQIADGSSLVRATGNADSFNTNYYLGDGVGYNVDSPTTRPPTAGTFPYTYWSTEFGPTGNVQFDTAQWRTQEVPIAEVLFSAQGALKTKTKTRGGIWQGFFLDGRIIPTIGYREDEVSFVPGKPYDIPAYRYSIGNSMYTEASRGMFDFQDTYNVVDYRTRSTVNRGITRTVGLVVKPLRWLHLTYNQSDSFDPASQAVDTYGDLIPNPKGESKDYGIRISMLDERLWFSLNKYEAKSINARNGGASRVATRAIPYDFDTAQFDVDNAFGASSANELDLFDWYFFQLYGDSSTPTGGTARPPGFNGSGDIVYLQQNNLIGATDIETRQRVTDHVYGLMGYTKAEASKILNTPAGSTRTAFNDVTSKGYELEINYRTRYWNVKLTGAKKQTIDSNIAASLTQYIKERQPILEAAGHRNLTNPNSQFVSYWLTNTGGTSGFRRDTWLGNVISPYNQLVQNLGKPRPQLREYTASLTTSYDLAGISSNSIIKNIRVGGGGSWGSKAAIGSKYKTPVFDPITNAYVVRDVSTTELYYNDPTYTINVWAAYDFRLLGRIKSSVQLNVQNLQESGRLQPVSVKSDGTPWAYRIVDPRLFQLTVNFEL